MPFIFDAVTIISLEIFPLLSALTLVKDRSIYDLNPWHSSVENSFFGVVSTVETICRGIEKSFTFFMEKEKIIAPVL